MPENLKKPTRGFSALLSYAKQEIGEAKQWMQRQSLLIKHAQTLARYNNKDYIHDNNTISIEDAFNQELLKPTAFISPLLATQVSKFSNKKVLAQWNEETCHWMASNGGLRPHGAIPLNQMLRTAAYAGDLDMLDWLVQLKNPSEKLAWRADLLLANHLQTASWAFWRPQLLKDDNNPEQLLKKCLEPGMGHIERDWNTHIDKPYTDYTMDRQHMNVVNGFVANFMHLYFPNMPWQERWAKFVAPLAPESPHPPSFLKNGIQGLLAGYVYVHGMLDKAPLDVQKCLAAFKNSSHPKESMQRTEDAAPKAIRHAFFGGPPPLVDAPQDLQAWLLLMQGTPPMQAAQAWIAWQSSTPALTTNIELELPSNVFGPA